MSSTNLTGKPSVDRPWLQYYPEPLRRLRSGSTVKEYLKMFRVRMGCVGSLWKSGFWRSVFQNANVADLCVRRF